MNKDKNNKLIGAIVLNGEQYDGKIEGDIIVGVDGGYEKTPNANVFVGDCDSINSKIDCENKILLNVDKDNTDGEVALKYLLDQKVNKINFYGVTGGRLDHILMNLSLLASCVQSGVKAEAHCNNCDIYMVQDEIELELEKNTVISLVPFTDNVHIISLEGVKWTLSNENLSKFSTRTISNIVTAAKMHLSVDSGLVMVIVNK